MRPVREIRRGRVAREDSSLRTELKLIEAARARLHDSPVTALMHAGAHARAFPDGSLALERELLRVEALLATRRPREARKVAEQLAHDAPGSAYARHASSLVERATRVGP
jgi:hypothetical protein